MNDKRNRICAGLVGGALVLCAAGCTVQQQDSAEEATTPEPVASAQASARKDAPPHHPHVRLWRHVRHPAATPSTPAPR